MSAIQCMMHIVDFANPSLAFELHVSYEIITSLVPVHMSLDLGSGNPGKENPGNCKSGAMRHGMISRKLFKVISFFIIR